MPIPVILLVTQREWRRFCISNKMGSESVESFDHQKYITQNISFLENDPLWRIKKLNCKRSKGSSSLFCLCWNIFGNTVIFTLNRNGDDIFVLQLQVYSTGVKMKGEFRVVVFFFFLHFCSRNTFAVISGARKDCSCGFLLLLLAVVALCTASRCWNPSALRFDAFRLQRRSWAE